MEKACIPISGVKDVTERGVKVVDADTGKDLCLPRKHAELYHGRVFIPVWLFNKIKGVRSPTPRIEGI